MTNPGTTCQCQECSEAAATMTRLQNQMILHSKQIVSKAVPDKLRKAFERIKGMASIPEETLNVWRQAWWDLNASHVLSPERLMEMSPKEMSDYKLKLKLKKTMQLSERVCNYLATEARNVHEKYRFTEVGVMIGKRDSDSAQGWQNYLEVSKEARVVLEREGLRTSSRQSDPALLLRHLVLWYNNPDMTVRQFEAQVKIWDREALAEWDRRDRASSERNQRWEELQGADFCK